MNYKTITHDVFKTKRIQQASKKRQITKRQLQIALEGLAEHIMSELFYNGRFHWRGMFELHLEMVRGSSLNFDKNGDFYADYAKVYFKPSKKMKIVARNSEAVEEIDY